MSDETPVTPTETVAPAATADTTPVEGAAPEVDLAAEAAKWKAMARKHEDQAKANADKAKRLDALEEANKTELEKITARAEAAEAKALAAEAKALRADVATAKGVPAHLLSGSTQEELEAAADELLAFKGTTPKVPSATGQGDVGTPIGGALGQVTKAQLESMTPTEINEARRAGRLKDLFNS